MRISLVPDVDSRDGTSNRDERLTNVLSENDEDTKLAVIRPGLVTIATSSGAGGGAVEFNRVLITVFGTTLGYGTTPTSISTVTAGDYDFCQSPL